MRKQNFRAGFRNLHKKHCMNGLNSLFRKLPGTSRQFEYSHMYLEFSEQL